MDYALHLLAMICIFAVLGQSLALLAGHGGQVSLAQAAFFAIGAYGVALASLHQASVLLALALSLLLTITVAIAIARIAARTVDDHFVLLTLGIQVVVYSIAVNWTDVTRGPMGIGAIPQPFIPLGPVGAAIVPVGVAAVSWFALGRLVRSPFGRVLRAISNDEVFVKSLGKNVANVKASAFAISGSFSCLAGAVFATSVGYIDPSSFTLDVSIFILSIVILGGMKRLGPIWLAAAFLVLLPEALRLLGVPSSIAGNIKQIAYGAVLVSSVVLGPRMASSHQQ